MSEIEELRAENERLRARTAQLEREIGRLLGEVHEQRGMIEGARLAWRLLYAHRDGQTDQ